MIKLGKNGQWKLLDHNMVQLATRLRTAQSMVVQQEAQFLRGKIIRSFKTSGRSNGRKWKANRPSTIDAKGSSKPLIDRGDLRNAIVVVPQGPRRAFVGVSSKKRSRDGGRLVDIAAVHEFGRVITMRVTKKMHAYVMAQIAKNGGPSGKGSGNFRPGAMIVIKIPERSFLRASVKKHMNPAKLIPRARVRYAKALGLRGGKSSGKAVLRGIKTGKKP